MKTTKLYPLQFEPQYEYRLWGGNNFSTLFKRAIPGKQLGESWEISGLKEKPSFVSNGVFKGESILSLMEQFPKALLGESVLDRFGKQFPLLIKFIDAKKPLSVQVHPNDRLAQERHQCFGKNEMWYIVDATQGAELTLGFQEPLTKEAFKKRQAECRIEEVLHCENIQKGDAIHVPAGLLHAIGGGILLAEIQQASDITYRVHDYNRIDPKTGEKRILHRELALDAIDFNLPQQKVLAFEEKTTGPNPLVKCPSFTTELLNLAGELDLDYSTRKAFTVLLCVEGECSLVSEGDSFTLTQGDSLLLPAELALVHLNGSGRLLAVTV